MRRTKQFKYKYVKEEQLSSRTRNINAEVIIINKKSKQQPIKESALALYSQAMLIAQ